MSGTSNRHAVSSQAHHRDTSAGPTNVLGSSPRRRLLHIKQFQNGLQRDALERSVGRIFANSKLEKTKESEPTLFPHGITRSVTRKLAPLQSGSLRERKDSHRSGVSQTGGLLSGHSEISLHACPLSRSHGSNRRNRWLHDFKTERRWPARGHICLLLWRPRWGAAARQRLHL